MQSYGGGRGGHRVFHPYTWIKLSLAQMIPMSKHVSLFSLALSLSLSLYFTGVLFLQVFYFTGVLVLQIGGFLPSPKIN